MLTFGMAEIVIEIVYLINNDYALHISDGIDIKIRPQAQTVLRTFLIPISILSTATPFERLIPCSLSRSLLSSLINNDIRRFMHLTE